MFDPLSDRPIKKARCEWCGEWMTDMQQLDQRVGMHTACHQDKKKREEILGMLDDLAMVESEDFALDDWEIDFVESLSRASHNGGDEWSPTEKQESKLREIHAKMIESGA